MPLINCEINFILTWSEKSVISKRNKAKNFKTKDTKLCVLVVTLLRQDSSKLLQQLKSDFKRTINWNKYQ